MNAQSGYVAMAQTWDQITSVLARKPKKAARKSMDNEFIADNHHLYVCPSQHKSEWSGYPNPDDPNSWICDDCDQVIPVDPGQQGTSLNTICNLHLPHD